MLKHIIIIVLLIISNALGAGSSHGGSWIEDWLYPDTGLFFWAVITFFIVFVILRWKAWGPLMTALDAREQQIKESLNKAEKIIEDQEKSAQDNEAILNKAREEAKNIVLQAKEAGDQLKQKFENEGQAKYEELVANASEQINTEKQNALNDIRKMVVDIAFDASEKIIKRNLNSEDNKKIIDETVDRFQNKN